jgi:hypothetical protein
MLFPVKHASGSKYPCDVHHCKWMVAQALKQPTGNVYLCLLITLKQISTLQISNYEKSQQCVLLTKRESYP